MKKNLLGAIACLSVFTTTSIAQTIIPCGTNQAYEYCIKNIPGYKAKMEAQTAAIQVDLQTRLQNMAAKTSSLSSSYTFTIPTVFHILHLGEPIGTGSNINDALCISALNQINKDYARLNSDTTQIDPLFEPLYKNSHIQLQLAKLDPYGNCTNGIVHHYNPNSNWKQNDLSNYEYSTVGTYNWSSTKYLNIYIVNDIISSDPNQQGIIVGYTYKPGTAPNTGADAIVYRNDFLSGTNARSLSHELGHWLGLGHTFGDGNNAGSSCGNDDIGDTPATSGFFSTCPKAFNFTTAPTVTTPTDSSDIVKVTLGKFSNTTGLNSLNGTLINPVTTGTVSTTDTNAVVANGTAGSYSDFSLSYPIEMAPTPTVSSNYTVSINSLQDISSNNYVGMFIDYNRNGSFADAGEAVYIPTVTVVNYSIVPVSSILGSYNFYGSNTPVKINLLPTTSPDSFALVPAKVVIPTGTQGLIRMRVVTSSSPITGPTMSTSNGEYEDYMLNIGLYSCDTIRPNIENIMDYSSCPKMFTQGQTDKMRGILQSAVANRQNLSDTTNLTLTGILNNTVTVCAPIADFYATKVTTCEGQTVTYNNTSFNSTAVTNYTWTFEGGSPSTSNAASPVVLYDNPGVYSVTLTVSNANGTDSESKTGFMLVEWGNDQITYPYIESFESSSLPLNWKVNNLDYNTITWQQCNYGSQGSSKSMVLPNANGGYWFDDIDILETPVFNFHNTNNITVSYDYSYARRPGTTGEVYKFQYSLDCGGTWVDMTGTPSTTVLAASGGTMTAPYIPFTQSKWVTKTHLPATLAALNNKSNVKFRFYFNNDPMTGSAQNLYIDRFNIGATVSIDEFANQLGLEIYPNPTSSSSTLEFTSPNDSKVTINVFDVTGRVVEQNELDVNAGQLTTVEINKSDRLTAGVYFVTLSMNNQKVTKKLIIE